MTQGNWNLLLVGWVAAGAVLLTGYLIWYAMQPKITRIEWGNGQIDYFKGRVDPTDLQGIYQASSRIKNRTVLIEPRF